MNKIESPLKKSKPKWKRSMPFAYRRNTSLRHWLASSECVYTKNINWSWINAEESVPFRTVPACSVCNAKTESVCGTKRCVERMNEPTIGYHLQPKWFSMCIMLCSRSVHKDIYAHKHHAKLLKYAIIYARYSFCHRCSVLCVYYILHSQHMYKRRRNEQGYSKPASQPVKSAPSSWPPEKLKQPHSSQIGGVEGGWVICGMGGPTTAAAGWLL